MSNSLPLKVKDNRNSQGGSREGYSDLQQIDVGSLDEKYLAWLAGTEMARPYLLTDDGSRFKYFQQLGGLTSGNLMFYSQVSASGRMTILGGQSGYLDVGNYSNSFYNQPVGTHPAGLITHSTITTSLNQLEYHTSNSMGGDAFPNYFGWDDSVVSIGQLTRPLMYGTVNDNDGMHIMRDSAMDSLADRLNGRIVSHDLAGAYRLDSAGFDSSETEWEKEDLLTSNGHTKTFASDTRTDGTSLDYHIWRKKGSLTKNELPSDIRDLMDEQEIPFVDKNETEKTTFKIASKEQLSFTLGHYCLRRRGLAGNIGTYELRSDVQGSPTATGNWRAVGTANDTRNDVGEVNHIKPRYSAYTRFRTVNYTGEYSGAYVRLFIGDYTGNYIRSYVGDYTGDFMGDYIGQYIGAYTRVRITNSADPAGYTTIFTGNYTGNYTGDFTGDYTGNYVRKYVGNYATIIEKNRDSSYTRLRVTDYTGNTFVGDFIGDYVGSKTSTYSSTSILYYQASTAVDYVVTEPVNYTGNYIRRFVGNYTRLSTSVTRETDRNEEFTNIVTDPKDKTFTGDFTTIYTGDYTGAFTRKYAGNYTGEYSRIYVGNYVRRYVGNYTGDYVAEYKLETLYYTGSVTFTKWIGTTDYFSRTISGSAGDYNQLGVTYTAYFAAEYSRRFYESFAMSIPAAGRAAGAVGQNFTGQRQKIRSGPSRAVSREGTGAGIERRITNYRYVWWTKAEYYTGTESYARHRDIINSNFTRLNRTTKTPPASVRWDKETYSRVRLRSRDVTTDKTYIRKRVAVTRITDYTGTYNRLVITKRPVTYTGNFITDYTGNYVRWRNSSYTRVSIGGVFAIYTGIYTRFRSSAFTRIVPKVISTYSSVNQQKEGISTGYFTGNYSRRFVGNYTRRFAGDYTGYANPFTRVSTREINTDFTRLSIKDYTGNFVGDYVGDFTGDYSRARYVNYQQLRQTDFLRTTFGDFTRLSTRERFEEYTGEYVGDYHGVYGSAFSRVFTGDYVGSTILSGFVNHRVYTLYARIS